MYMASGGISPSAPNTHIYNPTTFRKYAYDKHIIQKVPPIINYIRIGIDKDKCLSFVCKCGVGVGALCILIQLTIILP